MHAQFVQRTPPNCPSARAVRWHRVAIAPRAFSSCPFTVNGSENAASKNGSVFTEGENALEFGGAPLPPRRKADR
jgi:hypothetical protein